MYGELDQLIDSHEATNNAFFTSIAERTLSPEELARFGPEYYYWIKRFPAILASLMARTPDSELQAFLSEILFSELGSGDTDRMHFLLFGQILERLGVDAATIESGPKRRATERLVSGMLELYSHEDLVRAMGAQYALERQAFAMIERLYEGFKRFDTLTSEDFGYFEIHLVEEPEHLDAMLRCMARCIRTKEEVDRAISGASACLDLIAGFWNDQLIEAPAKAET